MLLKASLVLCCLFIALVLAACGFILLFLWAVRRDKRRLRNALGAGFLAVCLLLGPIVYIALQMALRGPALASSAWKTSVSSARDFFTDVERMPADAAFADLIGKPIPPEITNIQGIRVDEGPLFLCRNYYFRYHARKEVALSLVASLPVTDASAKSDKECRLELGNWSSNTFRLRQTLLDAMPFWKPEEVQNREFFTCFRFPRSHTIMFDKSSDLVYHVVQEIVQD